MQVPMSISWCLTSQFTAGVVGDTGSIAITQLLILMTNSPSTFQRSSQKLRLNILNFWTPVHLRSSVSLRWVAPEATRENRHRQMPRSASLLPEPRVIEQLNGTLLSNALWFFPSHHTQTALHYSQNKRKEHSLQRDNISQPQWAYGSLTTWELRGRMLPAVLSSDGNVPHLHCPIWGPLATWNVLGATEKPKDCFTYFNFNSNSLLWPVSTEIASFMKN